MGELALGHELPVAIYSYALADASQSQSPGSLALPGQVRTVGVWSPLCDYSPEWVAIRQGLAVGADVRFIDLPAWDEAFRDIENRYADRELTQHQRQLALGQELGFDSSDSLWDHLFEDPVKPVDALMHELECYFEALRSDDPTSERDMRREAYMARWIAWAMGESDGVVLVVCGGFHAPALRRIWSGLDEVVRPTPPPPEGRTGSYLVPFSMRRLDSFTGYASGMPSPAFYQAVWHEGALAWESMLVRAVERLRGRGQIVSTSDVLAASELAHGLARLRGHRTPSRTDVLDALVGAFIKDALRQAPPWTVRGVLPKGTDPILVEVVAAFSGDLSGRLAPGTPRPPLIDDVEALCATLDLRWDKPPLSIDPLEEGASQRRDVLHRLRILDIPGVVLVRRASLARGASRAEVWNLERKVETDATLIERAVYGADLASAALACLRERVATAQGMNVLIGALEDAVTAGYFEVADVLIKSALEAIEHEPQLTAMGHGLVSLISLEATLAGRPLGMSPSVYVLLIAALERAGWLLEGRDGVSAPFEREEVAAVAAMLGALRTLVTRVPAPSQEGDGADAVWNLITAVFHRRVVSAQAPPWIKGACLGALWVLEAGDETLASATLKAIPDVALGDMLVGLLSTAREPFGRSQLLALVDQRLAALDEATFLAVLPSLRAAFAQLPPSERLGLARRLATSEQARALVAPLPEVDLREGHALEARTFELVSRYGLVS